MPETPYEDLKWTEGTPRGGASEPRGGAKEPRGGREDPPHEHEHVHADFVSDGTHHNVPHVPGQPHTHLHPQEGHHE